MSRERFTYPSFESLTEQRDRSEFRSTIYAVIGVGLAVGVVLLLSGEFIARIIAGSIR